MSLPTNPKLDATNNTIEEDQIHRAGDESQITHISKLDDDNSQMEPANGTGDDLPERASDRQLFELF